MRRRTIAQTIEAEGTALHAGTRVRMTLAPAEPGRGVIFRRSDLAGGEVAARYDRVAETRLGTVIAEGGVSVGVIEHLMAAVAGSEIDDLLVTLDGPEPPILDGDALSYLVLIEGAGIAEHGPLREFLKIERPVQVAAKDAKATLAPSTERRFDFEIQFASAAIGAQSYVWTFSRAGFAREIAPARTFGFVHELEQLRKAGLGRGASLENTLAVEGDLVLNSGIMRFPDEFVRHKILDALGDMALAGAPVIGQFSGVRSGHALNNALLRALFADEANYSWQKAP